MEGLKERIGTEGLQTFSLARVLVLVGLLFFHLGLVFRFRIVHLFPSEWVGYFVLGIVFFAMALGLIWLVRSPLKQITLPLPDAFKSDRVKPAILLTAIVLAALGILWRFQVYNGTRIHSSMGDMLPLIDMVTATFLAGEFPYKIYELPWKIPLTYMPGMWMPYLPAQVFDFDLRHMGLLFTAGTMVLMIGAGFRRQANTAIIISCCIVIGCFSLSPAIARFSINGHTYPLWLYIALFGFCMLKAHYKTAALCFGLMLATRQTSVVYLPFLLVFFWHQGGLRPLLTNLVLMGLACGILCLPFALLDYKAFLFDPMQAYKGMAHADFQLGDRSFASKTIGFAYALKHLGWLADLNLARLGLLALLPFVAWYGVKDTFSLLVAMGAAGILFAVLAPVSWYYIYVPPILLISFGVLSEITPVQNISKG